MRREALNKVPELPPDYQLDSSHPDILVLRRPDGTAVASFSAEWFAIEAVERAAVKDLHGPWWRRIFGG
jgi:hypothetical protein